MTTDAVRASDAALPSINRRHLLTGGASAIAAAAVMAPVTVEAGEPEHAWDRVRRLADELSQALAEGDGYVGGPGGEWLAEVYPVNGTAYPIKFGNIKSLARSRRDVSQQMQNVIQAHVEAREALSRAVVENDREELGREPSKAARRRYDKACRGEERALRDVCAFKPNGLADAKAKTKYLARFSDEFQPMHIAALIQSQVPA